MGGISDSDLSGKSTSMKFLHTGFDARIQCRYLLVVIGIAEYLELVSDAYTADGGIDGQRGAIRTATGVRIRRRLSEDLAAGAIIPPIVLGTAAKGEFIDKAEWSNVEIHSFLNGTRDKLSIIDGIQRTTALMEVEAPPETEVRVEVWLAPSSQNLIYRMLVLNTGQIPWNLRRQMEVMHRSLIDEIQEKLGTEARIFRTDDNRRRTEATEFQANDVIEMYLAYELRKPHVDKETVLSDQFSKLDLIEAVSGRDSLAGFMVALKLLARLDREFAKANAPPNMPKQKFQAGRHIFDKVAACVGFMSAFSQFVLGRVGMDRDPVARDRQSARAEASCNAVISYLEPLDASQVMEFLALDTLTEVSDKRGGSLSIGEHERELFLSAFKVVFEDGESLRSLEPAWRSQ
jgi:hypothetical protein